MDFVSHLLQPLSTKRFGYQTPIQKYIKLGKGILIMHLKNEKQNVTSELHLNLCELNISDTKKYLLVLLLFANNEVLTHKNQMFG